MKRRRNIVLILFLWFVASIHANAMDYTDDIDAKNAWKMMRTDGALLIDVRDPVEFLYAGHAVGAINVPIFFIRIDLPTLQTRIKVAEVEKKKGKSIHVKKTYRPMMDENKRFVSEVTKAAHGDFSKPIIVICRSGERSAFAADKLAKNGFVNVYNLEEGYLFGWKSEGLPAGGE